MHGDQCQRAVGARPAQARCHISRSLMSGCGSYSGDQVAAQELPSAPQKKNL